MCAGSNGVGRNFTNNRTNARDTDDEHQPVGEDSKEEVGHGTRSDNGGALADGFVIEGGVTQFGDHRLDAFIEHFDIAAEGDEGDNKLGALLVGASPERFAKTDGKALNPDAAAASNPEMAKLVHGNQHAQRNNKRCQIPENAQHKIIR